jgi:Ecdysteroid kinase-like family
LGGIRDGATARTVSSHTFAMADDLKAIVGQKDVLAVVNKIHGPASKLLDYKVEKGTASVQGFMSSIMRVIAQVSVQDKVHCSKFLVKSMPELISQKETAIEFGSFEQEIGFFDECLPILIKNCPDVPVVKIFHTNLKERIFYMEDLRELGFVALVRNFSDLKHDFLTMDHFKLIMETHAKFHSASLGINWEKQVPSIFEFDILYGRESGVTLFVKMIKQAVEDNILPIVELEFPKNESVLNSVKWLASDECFKWLQKLSKSDPKWINVLCHGDCWANNLMFKIDPVTDKPMEIKMIDFQIVRYAPLGRDLLYFMYMCTSCEFRKKYENDLIKMYVKAFNDNCVEMGRDERVTFDEFYEEYDKARMYGLIMAVSVRHMVYVDGCFPKGEDKITEENFQKLLDGGSGTKATMDEFIRNEDFRNEMTMVSFWKLTLPIVILNFSF